MEKIQILMPLYKPNIEFLKKQITSLENQDYKNKEIIFYNDCMEDDKIADFIKSLNLKIKYSYIENSGKNLGYTKAFELLVRTSDSDFIAFCDQDDIWDPNKLTKCINFLKLNNKKVVVTDKKLIDKEDNVICDSYFKKRGRPYNIDLNNEEIGLRNFFSTFADGLCVVCETKFAQSCVPFCYVTGHDKWIISFACAANELCVINDPLVMHRKHGNNTSGILKNIKTKEDYYKERVLVHYEIVEEFKNRTQNCKYINIAQKFASKRKDRCSISLLKYYYINPKIVIFETFFNLLPSFCFNKGLSIAKYVLTRRK